MAPHPTPPRTGAEAPDAARKAELRAAALAARDALDPAARQAASTAIGDALLALPELARARLVGAFWPIRSEVDPRPAAEGLRARGQAVALPHVTPDGLVFREWRAGDALVAGRFGLSEPDPSLPPVEPDALIVPLAAFDRTGQRIGYGRGYYDGAIARLSRTRPVLTVGIGFAAQEVGRVPAEPHDRPLQFVITEDGVIRCDRTA
ncbi:5-formyltetrahydrofolate cyclo-ligase [Methylobacterium sp. PvP062]|uniref:5-formyltetrahydrofolate cyclo-ligase n=1 Tax=Methylobacterium radiotolerans (strain ATCC 27329 / DSM 1819 / JCM 2831 / NBRC 15690 / NCIMB 10815 / 0-1) TaxID=426355 RepID=B1LYC5_METRJ|nr:MULTISPECIES: 5-formyltetrahydrofolate cyclo-ligase [Methylobacterium]MCX7332622.1 5-formyltetrahydrofolate cyclo-ligase [Hyphomicrobiales bacterium]GAN47735.1 5-formyltetrahydrofolate cyclo-ligase [Methylobacterium sp. ME121]ACB27309.1 5-formyltetrahydrofolate cyclo-ligase [Methylobacterium radiotolerans JCM 2831]KIU27782.1 5-formyltetrahydrofolate cyclo-ligase [Methylobacterium radiotolerans]KTS09270.1 5-formyltetrahydrofolate cyclo-ligase [Methylobacterium radiotolerans]